MHVASQNHGGSSWFSIWIWLFIQTYTKFRTSLSDIPVCHNQFGGHLVED